MDPENHIVQYMDMAGLTVDKGNMAFAINAEDRRDPRLLDVQSFAWLRKSTTMQRRM